MNGETQTHKQTMDGWMDSGWVGGWMDGWMDGRTVGGWVDGWIYIDRFAEYNQQDATFHSLFISVQCSTCFRRFFHPSSHAQNCTYTIRYLSDQCLTLYVQFWAPDDGRKNRLKHAEHLTEINKLWNAASCWLYSANLLVMRGPMDVKKKNEYVGRWMDGYTDRRTL